MRRPDLTAEVRAAVVRDYLRGDKTVVILFNYKLSPGEMYRILHAHRVKPDRKPDGHEEPQVMEAMNEAPSLEVSSDDNAYTSYFEDVHGDQFILRYDWIKHEGCLWCADYSWEKPIIFIDLNSISKELVIGQEIRLWLTACWNVIDARLRFWQ